MCSQRRARASTDHGFSLIELLLVCVMIATVTAISAGFFRSRRAAVAGNANIRKVESLLKLGRETAINERRAVVMSFTLFGGLPDTPDGFGRDNAVDFGAATSILFTADGTLSDQLGNSLNGTVFIGQAGSPMTARALTVFGPTATMRVYLWNGSSWRH